MNVDIIRMDPEEARRKYRAAIKEKHADAHEFHQACAQAYNHLAAGRQLLSLSATIRGGGLDDSGRPRFAVARADRREVYFEWRRGNPIARYSAGAQHHRRNAAADWPTLSRFIDMRQTFQSADEWLRHGYAMVPAVPADVRPKVGQLRDWFVLWEVGAWANRSNFAPVPEDPFLLEHVGGDLYAVLAHWDLTPLERAILDGLNRPA